MKSGFFFCFLRFSLVSSCFLALYGFSAKIAVARLSRVGEYSNTFQIKIACRPFWSLTGAYSRIAQFQGVVFVRFAMWCDLRSLGRFSGDLGPVPAWACCAPAIRSGVELVPISGRRSRRPGDGGPVRGLGRSSCPARAALGVVFLPVQCGPGTGSAAAAALRGPVPWSLGRGAGRQRRRRQGGGSQGGPDFSGARPTLLPC